MVGPPHERGRGWGRRQAARALHATVEALGVGGITMVVAVAGLNLSNFVFHVVVSRMVGPAHYGELSALLGVVTVLSVPLGALEATVAQTVAESRATGRAPGARSLLAWAGAAGTLGALAWCALVVPVDDLLRIASPLPALCLALWVALTVVGAVLQGLLIGQRRFGAVAASQVVGSGLVRLVAAVVLVGAAGLGVTGAVLATPIAAVVSLAILAAGCGRGAFATSGLRVRGSDALRSVAGLGGATLLSALDAWLARHFLPAAHAGWFAAASTAGRMALFFPGAITTVTFPALAATGGRGPVASRRLARAVGLVAVAGLAVAAVLLAVPGPVVSVLFGAGFAPAAAVLPVIALADAGIGVVSLLTYFFVSRRSRWSLAAWGACGLAVLLGAAFHGSDLALAWDMLAASSAAALALGVAAWASLRSDSAPGEGQVPSAPRTGGFRGPGRR